MSKNKVSRDENSYYVAIKEPLETRRHLLESTKKVIMSLQNYHKLLLIRKEKLSHLENLKQSIKELSYLNLKLSQKLPDYNIEIMSSFKKQSERPSKKKETEKKKKNESTDNKKKEKEKKIHEQSELEKLEASLAAIESKLKDLN